MDSQEQNAGKKEGAPLRYILLLLLAALLVIFTLQNREKVSVKLFFWNLNNIPLPLLIIVCLLLGATIPYFSWMVRKWRRKFRSPVKEEDETASSESGQPYNPERKKPDPEGIVFDDQDEHPTSAKGRTNFTRGFFGE